MTFLATPHDSIGHSRCCTDEGSGPAELVSFGIWASRVWGQGSNRHQTHQVWIYIKIRDDFRHTDAHFILGTFPLIFTFLILKEDNFQALQPCNFSVYLTIFAWQCDPTRSEALCETVCQGTWWVPGNPQCKPSASLSLVAPSNPIGS